jgi:2-C-methyl-D-erythritol 4-phosphate cytidylyltransferase
MTSAKQNLGVVVVAGGTGSRFQSELPKQFHSLGGKPVVCWALDFFLAREDVAQVALVMNPEFSDHLAAWRAALSEAARAKFLDPVEGGSRRQDSVINGLKALDQSLEWCAIHDGARPFPPVQAMDDIAAAISGDNTSNNGAPADGYLVAIPSIDSLRRVGPDHQLVGSVDRSEIWRAQTPQIFRRAALLKELEARDGELVTDESEVMLAAGHTVQVIEGSHTNLKITHPDDLALADFYAQRALDAKR